jgi:hypothetical protein
MDDLFYNPEKVYNRVSGFKSTLFSKLTPDFRCLPDFFIGGAQKGGTTSLYDAIIQHPQIIPAKTKETFYYGTTPEHEKGLLHYRQFFTSSVYKQYKQWQTGKTVFTLDASTNTLDSKEAPARILKDNPKAKLIFMLRNPTERAYSHYKMAVKMGWELADFETALELEEKRIIEGTKHVLSHPRHNYAYQRLGYRARGNYASLLQHWLKEFPRENILITSSEIFFENPIEVYNSICGFLGIDSDVKVNFGKLNEGSSEKMNLETWNKLNEFYKPYNEALFKLLNQRFNW